MLFSEDYFATLQLVILSVSIACNDVPGDYYWN